MPSCRTSPPSFSLLLFRCLSSAFVTRSDRAVVSWPPLPSVHASVALGSRLGSRLRYSRRYLFLGSSRVFGLSHRVFWFSRFGLQGYHCACATLRYLALGLCALLWVFVLCFEPLCLASGILRTRLAPLDSTCAFGLDLRLWTRLAPFGLGLRH